MTKKGLDRMDSKTLCTANRRNGEKCLNYAIKGATVCRMHGGSAPQVRAAAQVRILMASDLAAKKLIELMASPKVDDRVKLAAARDLLDRANLAGTQNVEVGITKRTFDDVLEGVLVDVEEDEAETIRDVLNEPVDAEVIEDAPPAQNRFDRATFAGVERATSKAKPSRGPQPETQARTENHSAIARGREAYLRVLDSGGSVKRAQRAAERAATGETSSRSRRTPR